MKVLSGNKGLTMIEVIVSMAILGIIVSAFLGVFAAGVKTVYNAGHRNKAGYNTQQVMEGKLAGLSTTDSNFSGSTSTSDTLHMTFGGIPVDVPGTLVKMNYDDGKRKTSFTSFVPN